MTIKTEDIIVGKKVTARDYDKPFPERVVVEIIEGPFPLGFQGFGCGVTVKYPDGKNRTLVREDLNYLEDLATKEMI